MHVAVNRDWGAGRPRTVSGRLGDLLLPRAVPLSPNDHQLINDVTPVRLEGWNDTMESRQVRAQETTCTYKVARETEFQQFLQCNTKQHFYNSLI